MAQETDVVRLDFGKAPPGYAVGRDVDGYLFIDAGKIRHSSALHNLGGDWREDVALSRAWAHYKAANDPPGMWTDWEADDKHFAPDGPGEWSFGTYAPDGRSMIESLGENDRDNRCYVRAKAWAWHDRRHALAARLEGEGVQLDMWPAALAWTDDECDECGRWPGMRATPDDFPAVLRRLAANDPEIGSHPLKHEVEAALAAGGAVIETWLWTGIVGTLESMCEDPEVGALIEEHAREARIASAQAGLGPLVDTANAPPFRGEPGGGGHAAS